jgi:hypothetical protein
VSECDLHFRRTHDYLHESCKRSGHAQFGQLFRRVLLLRLPLQQISSDFDAHDPKHVSTLISKF